MLLGSKFRDDDSMAICSGSVSASVSQCSVQHNYPAIGSRNTVFQSPSENQMSDPQSHLSPVSTSLFQTSQSSLALNAAPYKQICSRCH